MSRSGGRGSRRPPVQNRRYDRLALLDPREFERVVAAYYRRRGYQVEHCGTGRGGRRFDGGIDLKLYRDGSYTVVQCKRENALQVTHNVGHELLGVVLTEKADRAIVVNSGEFTPYAWKSARKDTRLELIDGDRLRQMLPEYALVDAPTAQGVDSNPSLDWPLSAPPSRPAPGRVLYGPTRTSKDAQGIQALVALGVLVMLVLWQCSVRTGTERVSTPVRQVAEPRHAQPQSPHPRPTQRPEAPSIERSRAAPASREIDAAEARRRADAAIRIIEDTTPELDLPPDPHAVFRK
jgi:restriction system protein